MQAYGPAFAAVYNTRWGGFARQVAPRIESFYAATSVGKDNKKILDVCCGTGQLAGYFLERGYRVTGIDLSEAMLAYARENNRPYVEEGRAAFLLADAACFSLEKSGFGLAISTFDSLNHLPDMRALRGCFRSVLAAVEEGGYFIFDLNTRLGLQRWNGLSVTDDEEMMVVTRGVLDEGEGRALTLISGFNRVSDGRYQRFEEVAYNTIFAMPEVKQALLEIGWSEAHFSRIADLSGEVEDPESEPRVWFVARK